MAHTEQNDCRKPTRKRAKRWQLLLPVSRGLALFLGGFSLLNLLGELRFPGFDANHWWIDFRPAETVAVQVFLCLVSIFLLAYSLRPKLSAWRRKITSTLTAILLVITIWNMLHFHILLYKGTIKAGFPVAFSLIVSTALAIVLIALALRPKSFYYNKALSSKIVFTITLLICLVGFPLGQMFCFGKTDYRRQADTIVVFGARVYADGRPSDALADRVRTGCSLYLDGLADRMIFSGGPGDGDIHETESMRTMAVRLGVPKEAILLDTEGLNTQATVENTSEIFDRLGVKRVLAVSHFYHMPRIKMSYQRRKWEVYTVPAKETYLLTQMPKYILREVAAIWLYYLRPIAL
ncbi:MAG: YdcF family protein [Planctomycetota bacterium]